MAEDLPDRVQTVRNAWINAIRAEVLRTDVPPELPRVAGVGMWIATYADADGGGAFPGRDTLARLEGCTKETVTRAVKVLMAVGLLARKRRPNASSVYQLLLPLERPNWADHIHLYTDTRQRRAHAAKKAADAAEVIARKASVDAVRTASTVSVPDSVHAGLSEPTAQTPDSVYGHPRTASVDAFRTASTAVAYQYRPTSGRTQHPDHDMAEPEPQPQVGAGAGAENEDSSPEDDGQAPELRTVPTPVGSRGRRDAKSATQSPLLMSVPTEYSELRKAAAADPGLVRTAVQQLGAGEAIRIYGVRLVTTHAPDLIATGT